ncbi:helix-turn-helix transcriptional regulator [Microbulbifer agarilyticus]|uniref:winged helix-turn-helix transcriptional regulator n=1 Tax=Microbulbifer agarilyticus TaxID=260552 RepID=UPI001C942FFB|nr:helix-turn-helix domain-containing protein [Microbulbifer agarilyticus]MBY6190934.1 helix-turn-helix transcriptional regulator [Microbulbifer agarilyticus]
MNSGLLINRAIAGGLDVIGDRWSLLILRDAFLGRRRFEEIRAHTGASRATLTRRLAALVDADVLYRKAYGTGSRVEYRLTATGQELFGASLLAWQWESRWAHGEQLPARLRHSVCGSPLHPRAQCRACAEEVTLDSVDWDLPAAGLEPQFEELRSIGGQRRVRAEQATGSDRDLATVSNLIGDRWTLLILIAAFFGVRRYDDYARHLSIASNILTQRLRFLVEAEVLERISYQQNPPRYEYRLAPRGRDLYPLVMVMRQWAEQRLPPDQRPLALRHKGCGQPLVIDVVCGECGQKPWPRDVSRLTTS